MNKSHKTMIEKYGGYEGYRAHMREIREKVKNPGTGFEKMSKKKHRKISQSGGRMRWKKHNPHASKEIQESQGQS